MRLASSTGRLVKGRCRATNLCDYCKSLYIVETVELLTLDALGGSAPEAWVVLTAREHLTRPEFNEAFRVVRQKLKRRGWSWDYFAQVEFQRRGALHVNLLVKGVGPERFDDFLRELVVEWCAHVDAGPQGQWGSVICEEQGGAYAVARYTSKMLAHGLKAEQAPPRGWKGHRTSHSRGYFGRPMWQVRREAVASLRLKRELYKAEAEGLDALEARHVAEARALRREQERYELVTLSVDENGELRRVRPAKGGGVTVALRSDAAKRARRSQEDNAGRALRALDELAAEVPLPDESGSGAPPPQLDLLAPG